jgi:precorrin-2 dehydrogenase/sirohydrochlorin ferrochelatase
VIAPELSPGIARLAREGQVEWRRRGASEADVEDAFLVIAATDDRDLNARIAAAANARGKLVNAVDQPDDCNFFVPATVRRGPVLLTVATGGASPALAKRLRQQLERHVGPEYGDLAELLADLRETVIAKLPRQADRSAAWERILDSPVLELIRQGKRAEAEVLARSLAGLTAQPDDEATDGR